MRAQFVKVDPEFLTDALAISTAAGISRAVLVCGFVDLLNRSLTQETSHLSADQVRGVFGCPPEPVLSAMVAFGVFAIDGDGWRIRGWEKRYREMFDTIEALAAGRSKGGKASASNLKRGSEQPAKRKPTQPALLDVEPTPSPPKPPRERSLQEGMHAFFLESRRKKLERDESEQTPDEALSPALINTTVGAFLRECDAANITDEAARVERWDACVSRFLSDPYFADRTPPWPFRMFATEKTKSGTPAGWRRAWAELETEKESA